VKYSLVVEQLRGSLEFYAKAEAGGQLSGGICRR